jgi:hypothetical protein
VILATERTNRDRTLRLGLLRDRMLGAAAQRYRPTTHRAMRAPDRVIRTALIALKTTAVAATPERSRDESDGRGIA